MTSPSDLHIFGIRHHGPGSARSLQMALATVQPDIILVEGPPDADAVLPWLAHPEMEPPVALIVYRPDQPQRATYYPFALFSPEWRAIHYAFEQHLPVHFMDLPQAHQLALDPLIKPALLADPLRQLAEAAGYKSYEAWWNTLVEQGSYGPEVFPALLSLMQVARETATSPPPKNELERLSRRLADQREAYMRQTIRRARATGHQRIAIVCGAWHAPALSKLDNAPADASLLADLPHVAVEAAWVPWTYSRLSYATGYGAGLTSPGWYHHLWQMGQRQTTSTEASIHWLTQVANLLREEGLDVSSAHLIEAVRLAEALAALRGLAVPGLAELNEATQTVICFGEAAPLRLIQEKLIVSERMGSVPPDTPMVPLQRDLHQLQKRLRLRPEPGKSTLTLDLRNELHLERSHLLHRLQLVQIPWGKPLVVRGRKGTYQEVWQLQWLPDFAVRVIEANLWGNTVQEAAANFAQDAANQAPDLAALTRLLDQIILADLPETMAYLIKRIEEEAALSSDIPHMMAALPPLARILRYGNVRKTDQGILQHVVEGLLRRICVGLPHTCAALADEAAAEMFDHLVAVHGVVLTLQQADHKQMWQQVLAKLADQRNMHGLVAGRACRLLLDTAFFSPAEAMRRLERALSKPTLSATEALLPAAFWLEGFLKGSGLLLLHDHSLWQVLDRWLTQLTLAQFLSVLPLLRRTFATFNQSIRQQLSERVRFGATQPLTEAILQVEFDPEQAEAVLPVVARLLGLKPRSDSNAER